MSDTSKWEMIDWSVKINIDEKNQHNTKVYRVLEDGTNQELRHGETKEFRLPPEDEGSQGSAQVRAGGSRRCEPGTNNTTSTVCAGLATIVISYV